jgi:hypothetical protein
MLGAMMLEGLGKPNPKKPKKVKKVKNQYLPDLTPPQPELQPYAGGEFWAGQTLEIKPAIRVKETGIVTTDLTNKDGNINIDIDNNVGQGSKLDKLFSFGTSVINQLKSSVGGGAIGNDNANDNRNNGGGGALGFDLNANKNGVGFGINLNMIALAAAGVLGSVLLYGMISGSKSNSLVRRQS